MSSSDRIERYEHEVWYIFLSFEGAQAPQVAVIYSTCRFYLNRELIGNHKINLSPIMCRPKTQLTTKSLVTDIGAQFHRHKLLKRSSVKIGVAIKVLRANQSVSDSRIKDVKFMPGNLLSSIAYAPRLNEETDQCVL